LLSFTTRSHSLWLHILKRQQQFLPLPPYSKHNTPVVISTPSTPTLNENYIPAVEAVIRAAHRTARLFPMPRRGRPSDLSQFAYKPGALVGLRLLGPTERWLVAVYTDGAIGVWDLGAGVRDWWLNKPMAGEQLPKGKRPRRQVACHVQPTSRWTSFEAAFEIASLPESSTDGEAVYEGYVYIVVNESL
jgi:hypothetical protein